jgi:hypothetical protein
MLGGKTTKPLAARVSKPAPKRLTEFRMRPAWVKNWC